MVLTFLGTRGEIEIRSRAHRRHSSLALDAGAGIVMIDCGFDWAAGVSKLAPNAILLTHAHPDHAGGLRGGSPCTVFASAVTADAIAGFSGVRCRTIEPRARFEVAGLSFEAFTVEHSLRAPAVGFRVTSGLVSVFYAPDVVAIHDRKQALDGVEVYVGDGAAITRPIVRTRDGVRIGHASIREQLGWCASENAARAVFTHCGSEIVRGDGRTKAATVRRLGRSVGVDARIARDGLCMDLSATDS